MRIDWSERAVTRFDKAVGYGRVAFGIKAATYPPDALLGRYAEGRVRVSTVATPPLVNQSFTMSCA